MTTNKPMSRQLITCELQMLAWRIRASHPRAARLIRMVALIILAGYEGRGVKLLVSAVRDVARMRRARASSTTKQTEAQPPSDQA